MFDKCPTCNSPQPNGHPVNIKGRTIVCEDPFHGDTTKVKEKLERRERIELMLDEFNAVIIRSIEEEYINFFEMIYNKEVHDTVLKQFFINSCELRLVSDLSSVVRIKANEIMDKGIFDYDITE